MDKSNCGIEDFAEIKKASDNIRLQEDANFNRACYSRIPGLNSLTMLCWCRKAGADGKDLPCPT